MAYKMILNHISSLHIIIYISGASILNQRVDKLNGFGLLLNQTKSNLVFYQWNQTKSKPLYFSDMKTKPKPYKLIFFL